jgi:hypothetical protein
MYSCQGSADIIEQIARWGVIYLLSFRDISYMFTVPDKTNTLIKETNGEQSAYF